MKQFITLLVIAGLCKHANAQFSDTIQHYVKYMGTGNVNKADAGDSYLLNNALTFTMKKQRSELNFNTAWIYGAQEKTLTNNDFTGSVEYNLYSKLRRFYYWGLTNYTTSYSLKVNNQSQTGAGIAYNLFNSKTFFLNISDGILFDKSDVYLQDTVRDKYQTLRNSFRLSFKINIKDIVTLKGVSFLQNSFQSQNDYIIRSDLNLAFKLRKWLALTASMQYNRYNRTDRENLLFNYGLTIEQYF